MESETEKLYKWIDGHQFSRQKRNISRDFSDAVPLAEILKCHFPKLVDLHNYAPKNSFAQKLINWETLQRKVLCKININLPRTTLEDLARAEPGAVEVVIRQVKTHVDSVEEKIREQDPVYVVEGFGDEEISGSIMSIRMKRGARISDERIVPAEVFNEMRCSIDQKQETIQLLENKIEHLEKMIKIKDERIVDLQTELDNVLSKQEGSRKFLPNIF